MKVGIKGEEAVYYGFAEGDQIIFSFEEANGKEMKEIEIVEMPATSRFIDVKTSKIENKTINVPRTAIYKFRFANSALLPRSVNSRSNEFLTALRQKNSIQQFITMHIMTLLILTRWKIILTKRILSSIISRTEQ